MSPATNKKEPEKTIEIGTVKPKTNKSSRKNPKKRTPERPGKKKMPITLHVFRELEFIRDLPDATFVIDRNGMVLAWNLAMEELTGFFAREILGKGDFCYSIPFYGERRPILIDLALNPDTCLPEIYDNLIVEKRVVTATTRYARPKGESVILWMRASPITDQYGTTIGAIETFRDITKQHQVEDQLRASEERFRALTENTSDIIRIFNNQGRIVFDTATSKRMLGYPDGFTLGKDPFEFIHPDDLERVKREFSGVYEKTNTGVPTEFRIRKADGSYVWVESVGKNLSDVPGIDGIVITTRFIDERKRAEQVLLDSDERYRTFLSHSNEGIFRFEVGCDIPVTISVDEQIALFVEHGHLAECNDAFARMYAYEKADEIIGASISHLMKIDSDISLDYMRTFIRSGYRVENFESKENDRQGNPRWFSNSLTGIIREGKVIRLWGVQRDITERKRAEESLKESEARYSSLFTNSYSVSILINPDTGMIVDANDAASKYYGYPKEQLTAMGIYDLNRLQKEKVVRNLVQAKDEKAKHFFSTHYLANGERRNVEVFSGPIAVQGKTLFYSIIHDITNRVKAEQALRDSKTQMKMIIQGSPIPKFVIDSRHHIISWNKALEEATGIKARDVIGTSLHWKAFYESERPCMADLIVDGALDTIPQMYAGKYKKSEIAEGGYEATDFFPHMGKNGTWLRYVAAPIRNFQGEIIGAIETLEDITGLMEAQHSLRDSEERYRTLIDQLPDHVIVHRNGILVYMNLAAAKHLGYEPQNVIGKPITLFIAPEYHDLARNAAKKRMAGEEVPPYEMMIMDHKGASHSILLNGVLIQFEGEPASLNVLTDITVIKEAEGVILRAKEELEQRVLERTESLTRTNIQLEQEITARNTAEQEIHRSLEEKELLLREIHHRVKNNLQIIASMLNLQSRTIKDKNVLDAIKDSQSRVRAMALVHERVYRSHNIGEIDMRDYLQYLVQQLVMFHNIPHGKVTITFTMEPVHADIDTIVPIGLIINEMVSNSLKHAFPGERKGSIIIEGSNPSPELLIFTYKDDGVGIPDDVDWKNPSSLGLRLITSLVEQCSGEITMERDGGTVYAFTIHTKKPVKMPGAKETPE